MYTSKMGNKKQRHVSNRILSQIKAYFFYLVEVNKSCGHCLRIYGTKESNVGILVQQVVSKNVVFPTDVEIHSYILQRSLLASKLYRNMLFLT